MAKLKFRASVLAQYVAVQRIIIQQIITKQQSKSNTSQKLVIINVKQRTILMQTVRYEGHNSVILISHHKIINTVTNHIVISARDVIGSYIVRFIFIILM